MYFDAPVQTEALQAGNDVRVVLSINGALVLVLGLFPGGLMALCARAVSSMMAG
jgi:NADH-quinone oxidoreductase subunit N